MLALRALGLGDALTGVPALRGLRRARPGHLLVLAGPPGPGELLRRRGVVDRVLPVEGVRSLDEGAVLAALAEHPEVLPPGRSVDLAVNLHGRGPQSARALTAVLDARGAPASRVLGHRCAAAGLDDGPEWDQEVPEVQRWVRLAAQVGGACSPDDLVLPPPGDGKPGAAPGPGPVVDLVEGLEGAVALHPGAASGSRRWPVERWAAVAADLLARGRGVVLTGGPSEAPLTAEVARLAAGLAPGCGAPVDLAGRCDLEQLAGLLGAVRALVCGDTGVAHLATALRTPSVLLFGPMPPTAWGPAVDRDLHAVLWPAPRPDHRGDPHGAEVDPVLAATTPSDVLAALADLPHRPGP
ncbi:glycosyltransferase family 9 protein [uncultured Pseudokineococcus sp.]|uniref:glycosyltransferase family 9 protein n=1 Tax=uncultured Pseudokineococcus sp. TaxID=1642928 RepID=UPI00262A9639|nr:glycosyltransferase family 9 protein [uncultured Pseudokineococcus sp.]